MLNSNKKLRYWLEIPCDRCPVRCKGFSGLSGGCLLPVALASGIFGPRRGRGVQGVVVGLERIRRGPLGLWAAGLAEVCPPA